MPSYESYLTVVKRKGRVSGMVTIQMSRLPVIVVLNYFLKGHSIKYISKAYPQLSRDELIVLRQLALDVKTLMKGE